MPRVFLKCRGDPLRNVADLRNMKPTGWARIEEQRDSLGVTVSDWPSAEVDEMFMVYGLGSWHTFKSPGVAAAQTGSGEGRRGLSGEPTTI